MRKLDRYKNAGSYCRYGTPFRKNTHIWSNVPDLELKVFNIETPCLAKLQHGRHLVTAQSGPPPDGRIAVSGYARNVYPIPKRLVCDLFRRGIEHVARKARRN